MRVDSRAGGSFGTVFGISLNSDCATRLDRPIIIIGAARSGTDLLPAIIKLHDDIAYAPEPNYVWKYGNAWVGHDMLSACQATSEVRRYIRNSFERFCAEKGKRRLCEKTPANSLRLAFVMQIMPDARVIHILRDGRYVAASARRMFYGDVAKISRRGQDNPSSRQSRTLNYKVIPRILQRSRQRLSFIPARDAVYYLPHFLNSILNMLGLRTRYMWGPRIPGFRQIMRSHSDLEVAALQWRTAVESVLNYRANHPEMAYLEVKYEDLCRDPISTAKNIYEFCDLDFSPHIERQILSLFADAQEISALKLKLTPDEEQQVTDQIAHTLRMLGYDPSARPVIAEPSAHMG
jgi:Sulfotransferase family